MARILSTSGFRIRRGARHRAALARTRWRRPGMRGCKYVEWDDLAVAPSGSPCISGRGLLMRRVFHVRHRVELDIDDVVADLFHPPDVDVLHDVTRGWIDGDRSARAFPFHAL